MTTIVYAHPYDGSFNHALLNFVKRQLKARGDRFEVLDLYADGFNPAMEVESLALFSKGQSADPLVKKYSDALLASDTVIFIFPIWWSIMPAIVDGFFDKVMLQDTAYKYAADGHLIPDRIDIKRTVIISTSESPSATFAPFFRDYFNRNVLQTVGMKNLEWYNCQQVSDRASREAFVAMLGEKI